MLDRKCFMVKMVHILFVTNGSLSCFMRPSASLSSPQISKTVFLLHISKNSMILLVWVGHYFFPQSLKVEELAVLEASIFLQGLHEHEKSEIYTCAV